MTRVRAKETEAKSMSDWATRMARVWMFGEERSHSDGCDCLRCHDVK